MAEYTLPDLPYDPGALEPHYSGEIVELHHGKHHAAYVSGANTTLDKLAEARNKGDFGSIVGLEKTLAFNVSGHVLHSIFWTNLSPDGGEKPGGDLGSALDEHLGSFDAWEHAFYLQYKNVKADFIEALWKIVNWSDVAERFSKARTLSIT